MRGHQCQHLFYLESADFVEDNTAEAVAAVEAATGEMAAQPAAQTADVQPTVSLYAIAGIRTANAADVAGGLARLRLHAQLHRHQAPTPPPPRHISSPDHTGLGGEWRPGSVSWSCPQCRTSYGTEDFDLRFFGIDLGGFEVILGVEFLRTLGPILWDFDDL